MRQGDDPRDIYWRKSTMTDKLVLRERARETRPDVELMVDPIRPRGADDSFAQQFERKIREIASRAVAHIKRGDGIIVGTTLGDRVRGDRNLGSDPVLRFLALLEAVDETKVAELRAARAARWTATPTTGASHPIATAPSSGRKRANGQPAPSADSPAPAPSRRPPTAGGPS
jgi:uncharacterized protein (DUF58 family)